MGGGGIRTPTGEGANGGERGKEVRGSTHRGRNNYDLVRALRVNLALEVHIAVRRKKGGAAAVRNSRAEDQQAPKRGAFFCGGGARSGAAAKRAHSCQGDMKIAHHESNVAFISFGELFSAG